MQLAVGINSNAACMGAQVGGRYAALINMRQNICMHARR